MNFSLHSSKIKINFLLILVFLLFSTFGYFKFAIISFIIVIIHEISHSLVSVKLGYEIEEIEIFPLGGVVKLNKLMGVNPQHEILIASAGPLSNMILAFISYILLIYFQVKNDLIIYFIYANLLITITNLLPILPLDGGRIVRSYLSYIVGVKNSTKILINISKVIILILFFIGIYFMKYNFLNILICFLAIYLYKLIKIEKEISTFIFIREITDKKLYLFNKGVIKTKELVVLKDTNIKNVINKFRPQRYHFIKVVDINYNIIGSLAENEIIEGLFKYGLDEKIEKLILNKKTW